MDQKEFESYSYQRVYQYIRRNMARSNLDQFSYIPGTVEGSCSNCLEIILTYALHTLSALIVDVHITLWFICFISPALVASRIPHGLRSAILSLSWTSNCSLVKIQFFVMRLLLETEWLASRTLWWSSWCECQGSVHEAKLRCGQCAKL